MIPLPNTQPVEKVIRNDGHMLDGHMLDIHSIFYTIQGEGPFSGMPAVFVRTAGCNLQCPNCDTDYTTGRGGLTPDEIVQRVFDLAVKTELVVLTGGEPFRQNVGPLVQKLVDRDFRVQVETNGTTYLDDFPWNHPRLTVVCSPKTHVNARVFPNVHHWKYVIDHRHVDEKTGLPTQVLGLYVPGIYSEIDPSRIWISPMDEQNEVANALNRQACVKSALRFGYRISLQSHKLLGVE